MRQLILSVIVLCVSLWAVPTAVAQEQRLWATSMTETTEGDEAFARLKTFYLNQGGDVANNDWVSVDALSATALGEELIRQLATEASETVQLAFKAEMTRTFVRKNGLRPTNGSVRWEDFRRIGIGRGGYSGFTQTEVDAALRTARASIPSPVPVVEEAREELKDPIITTDGGMVPGATVPVLETGEVRRTTGAPQVILPTVALLPEVVTDKASPPVPAEKTPAPLPVAPDCSAVQVRPDLAAIGVFVNCALEASDRAEASVAELQQEYGSDISELRRGEGEIRTIAENAVTPEELKTALASYQTKEDAEAQQRQNEERFATKGDLANAEARWTSGLNNFAGGFDNFAFMMKWAMTLLGVLVLVILIVICWKVIKRIGLSLWRGIRSWWRSVQGWLRSRPVDTEFEEVRTSQTPSGQASDVIYLPDNRRAS